MGAMRMETILEHPKGKHIEDLDVDRTYQKQDGCLKNGRG
jgi:hypothetical protein